MPWYYAESGRHRGPVDDAVFERLVSAGSIAANTLVWRDGMSNWKPYADVQNGAQPEAAEAPPEGSRLCSRCRLPFSAGDLAAFGSVLVCADCKAAFVQKLREGVLVLDSVRYGGFWIRWGAVTVDGIIGYVFSFIVAGLWFGVAGLNINNLTSVLRAEGVLALVNLAFWICYETWFVGRFGATPGKMTCRLLVVRPDGSRCGYARALARYFAKLLSYSTLCIGFLIAAFDLEKQTLHDRLCDTRVVRK